jgi:hypothetical protein
VVLVVDAGVEACGDDIEAGISGIESGVVGGTQVDGIVEVAGRLQTDQPLRAKLGSVDDSGSVKVLSHLTCSILRTLPTVAPYRSALLDVL